MFYTYVNSVRLFEADAFLFPNTSIGDYGLKT